MELKHALRDAEELKVPHTPSFRGLDVAAIGNMVVISMTYVVVVAVLISPQNAILNEVPVFVAAMAGNQALLVLYSALQVGDSLCGGDLNWAYGTDPFGHVYWSTTTAPAGAVDSRVWKRPATEMTKLVPHLVDSVIRYSESCSGFDHSQCHELPDKNAPGYGYSRCCWPRTVQVCLLVFTENSHLGLIKSCLVSGHLQNRCLNLVISLKVSDIQRIEERIKGSVDYIALSWNPTCTDILDAAAESSYLWGPQWASVVLTTFADAATDKRSDLCGSCNDRFKPLCKSGRCVPPTCDDAAKLCHDWTRAGRLARMYCPVRCGCGNLSSSLLKTGTESGCPPPCLARFRESVAQLPCIDALPGSAELIGYANMVARESTISVAAKNLRNKGCEGALADGFDACGTQATGEDLPFGLKGYKSIKHLCPVTCGCTHGALGCPDSCPHGFG